jgi:phosphoribosylamine---glycine ligase
MRVAISGVSGFGAREHAIAESIFRQNPRVELFCFPGNAGTYPIAKNINVENIDQVIEKCLSNKVDFLIVGPEGDLEAGIADEAKKYHLKVFGPSKEGVKLESDKFFAKQVMESAGVLTAPFCFFSGERVVEDAMEYMKTQQFPLVIKANGLAAGKGVKVVESIEDGELWISHLSKNLLKEGALIEQCLYGEEASLFFLVNSMKDIVVPLKGAQDHKRALDGDKGENTGGMGAYSDTPLLTPEKIEFLTKSIAKPIVKELKSRGIDYVGILYIGLMLTDTGDYVIEFNARFGDPEAQVILPRMNSNLLNVLKSVVSGKDPGILEWDPKVYIAVVLASSGYPGSYSDGFVINGIEDVPEDFLVFQGGTVLDKGILYSKGGRILSIVSSGDTIREARKKVYDFLSTNKLSFKGVYYRSDISLKADEYLLTEV